MVLARNITLMACLVATSVLGQPKTKTALPNRSFNAIVVLEACERKLQLSLAQLKDTTQFARNVPLGGTAWTTTKYTDWTSGFFAGQLWMMFEATGKDQWKREAERWQAALAPAADITWTHDLGFMVNNSLGHAWRITHDVKYKNLLMRAADNLDGLYNSRIGTTRSWTWRKKWPHPTIIDNMLNLEMLFWAGKNGGRRALYDHAYQHATTTAREHVRPNYSSYHVVVYDTATGKPIEKVTDQGMADTSTWARGQAWGIYGFAMAHRETRDLRFLTTAKRMADVFLARLPADHVPYWDLSAPQTPDQPRDASAAAVAASGLLELSRLCKEPMEKYNYREAAIRILGSLASPTYMAPANCPAILQHCTGSLPHKSEIDVSLVYADYYFIEALLRLRNLTN